MVLLKVSLFMACRRFWLELKNSPGGPPLQIFGKGRDFILVRHIVMSMRARSGLLLFFNAPSSVSARFGILVFFNGALCRDIFSVQGKGRKIHAIPFPSLRERT